MMSNNNATSTSLAVAHKAVKQLRMEASIRRIHVSQAATDLKNFCLQNAHKDPLLMGVPSGDNPFRPPKSCGLLDPEHSVVAADQLSMQQNLQRRRKRTEPISSGGLRTEGYTSASFLRYFANDVINLWQEQLMEKDQCITRLQDALRCEREKTSRLQSRCNQQAGELKRREQLISRMREKLSQFTDRHRDRGVSIEIINTLPKPSGLRDPLSRSARPDGRKEEALRLMLERREAELREAMKLRHSLTTLLHAFKTDMQQTLKENINPEEEEKSHTSRLVQTEQSLGDHVTGGVILEWTHVQQRLRELRSESLAAVGTDQEKLLVQLEAELEQSRELVRVQQQLLQDSVAVPFPETLIDSYYLEEWERLQDKWAEFNMQRRTFQQERQAFTDAAIRLGRERCEFEQQKASLLKQQFLSTSPVKTYESTKTSHSNRRESTALSELRMMAPDRLSLSSCVTPSSEGSEVMPWSGQKTGMTPNTPELYCVLQLPFSCRETASSPSEIWVKEEQKDDFSRGKQNMDNWPF
ncbi:Afadin- and alpha-actinin-binding protein B [Bagarius yarrelli]|uniref:Guanine nucleotide-binding protein subunit gamma n=1 Tax=Bagarius yarrelli TaxID=175774 RepID=A0A556TL65_BAGYA|nr:Afadin- and alpha-actinin-binding protein B [Bagarius yarrelli]